tara:strand:+ start:4010 stop:4219 length:210 start_codon:yes stop_codon:yes gene_type:complete
MIKILLSILLFLFLNNCSTPGSAFLGPIFTGAKTGSIYQSSLSFGTNHFISEIKKLRQKKIKNLTSLHN